MASRTVRRVAVAIASTAVAAAGLLATGGSASAATYPSSSQSGVVSAVRIADHYNGGRHNHNGDRHSAFGSRGSDGRGHWKRDHDGGRHWKWDHGGRGYWKRGHDDRGYWIRYDARDGHRARIDDGRRQRVLDQFRWAGDHGHASWGSVKHHDRSHR
ncbi:hypothetical protein [Streptomyces sp. NPDC058424]|uniref:hypothetical protein n=1 Tax=Streptomyces sp. NPDC058424 TaxID=3346491 RepID=UPI00365243C6